MALHHLHNVMSVSTSFSWRYCIIYTTYTSRYIVFPVAIHHYTTLHQLIHLAALHHLRNVIPVDTSYSWRYSTIYTTLYQSIHLIPGGIPPFTQRYTNRYILFLAVLHHLHNVISVNTSFPWRYYTTYTTLHDSVTTSFPFFPTTVT